MRILLLSILSGIAFGASAQSTIPFNFTSEEDNRQVKENDSVKYYVATGDSLNRVTINEETSYYRLLGKDKKVIAEGPFIAEGDKYLQDGKWIQYFDNGKTKLSGYYRRNMPVGTWQEFYSSGRTKTTWNYGIMTDAHGEVNSCLSGSYQEFYPDGKLKLNGFYSAGLTKTYDTIEIEDPIDGHKYQKVATHTKYAPTKTGHWEYYTEEGEFDKKEDY